MGWLFDVPSMFGANSQRERVGTYSMHVFGDHGSHSRARE